MEKEFEALHDACITFIKDGGSEDSVRQMFNEYAEEMYCNRSGSRESIIGHREIVAQRVVIGCIHCLSWNQQEQLQNKLYEFAQEWDCC